MISRPRSVRMSRATLRLPRLFCSQLRLTPWTWAPMPWVMRPRYGSPDAGFSILITSAPWSAMTAPAAGTNTHWASSRIRTPSNIPVPADTCPSESIELGAVLPEDLFLVLVTELGEPLVGQALGVRPRGLGVRIVAGPHEVVDPDVVAFAEADRILHEGPEHLAPEIEARRLLQLALGPVPVLLPQVVGVVLEEGDPADLTLDGDELQVRVALHHEAVDQLRDRLGHRELAHDQSGHEPGRAFVDARHRCSRTPPADVQADRETDLE